jgi:DNA-binding transcriptional ArsR family regulator
MSNRQQPNAAVLTHAAPLFAALGDGTRLHLVARLSAAGPLSIARLSEGLPISRQAVTKHLLVLQAAGVISGTRQGRQQVWDFEPQALDEARRCLDLIAKQWTGALQNLKTFLENT